MDMVISHTKLQKAKQIEDILCLSTLIASGELSPNATLDQSQLFFEEEVNGDCGACPFFQTCLACIINE